MKPIKKNIRLNEGYRVTVGKSFAAYVDIYNIIEQLRFLLSCAIHGPESAKEKEMVKAFIACLTSRAAELSSTEINVSDFADFHVDYGKSYLEIDLVPVLKKIGSIVGIYFYENEYANSRVTVGERKSVGQPTLLLIKNIMSGVESYGKTVLVCDDVTNDDGTYNVSLGKILSTDLKDVKDFQLFAQVLDSL